jgi:TolB-like protein/class 3 adenylate cyclase
VPVHSVERKLAAILAADVVGYSRLMGEDEAGTLSRLRAHRRELIDPKISEHKGRIVKTTGDGILIEFPSVVEAVACAVAVQRGMAERNAATPEEQRIVFRVGINLGDIIIGEDNDIHGDGVNVAARLEAISEPGGICISGTVRDHIGDRLDLSFEDMGEQSLKNIARPVRAYRVWLGTAEGTPTISPAETTPTLALLDKPSIAVLPFQNISGDPEQEYFADGMVEEIITALSRIRWLFVIARNSSFSYKDQAIDVRRVGRELGVRYVVEGSVRKGGGRVRITAQLIDTLTGAHLWADRFDGSLDDVFDLQDQVATSVAGVIEPTLQAAETGRLARRPTNDMAAYDLYLRAYAMMLSSARRIPEALHLLEQAIARDPNYGPALAVAAICCMRLALHGSSKDPDGDRRKGIEFGRHALQVADDDPVVLANAAFALPALGEDIDAMMMLADRAVSLNPSYARGWYVSGSLRRWAGQPEAAIERLKTAQRLAPRGRIGFVLYEIGSAYFAMRRFDEAVANLVLAVREEPEFEDTYRFLAASYALMGRLEEAQTTVDQLRAITPQVFRNAVSPGSERSEQWELLRSGLRLAIGEKE